MQTNSWFKRSVVFGATLAGAMCLATATAFAQSYPAKPIRVVVPFPAGGTQDVLMRLIAEPLGARLKQAIVIENRGGAAGNLGADVVAKAAPDGYTLGLLSGVHTANMGFYRKIPFNLETDFVPVKAVGESAVLIVTGLKTPYANAPEFVQYVKTHPGKVQMGSTTSFSTDLLKMQMGGDIQFIPYKGVGEALQDLIGERLDVVVGPSLQLVPLVKEGKVRALGLGSSRRIPDLPDVAPFIQTVPGYDVGMWFGVFAPKGTPAEVVTRLNTELAQVLKQPELREKLQRQGIDLTFSDATTEQLQKRMRDEIVRWKALAAKTGNYAN
ncbi:Bug family tripartite tricarboxylate transporter substrate binding protein [Diaphorobacter caeni]|uniref:Bug family tripartite tricarboxylate transporter substrate binding protein n=1 Tax=Diaphorobacter caeni TaxID=2784387 RepID=UPI00188F5100|nr:tripartite tricarboxylate transporter substrate-binding protein [Diaphorobacter caeni]MBF5003885.1 tripartite tricarboxylate transporter substrate binding protein [Diaphorobacter caeni]